MQRSWYRRVIQKRWPRRCCGLLMIARSWSGCAAGPSCWPSSNSRPSRSWLRWPESCSQPAALPQSRNLEVEEFDMVSGSTAAGSRVDVNAVAPLTPNAWLRYDLVKRMLPVDITDVLEIGCGQGALGARLAQRYRYLGVEPDQASWTVAQRRVSAVGPGEVRNISVEALGDERFDLVCAFEVLEHIEDDAATVKEWAARLRPGGWLLLSVPAGQRRFGPADELAGHFRRYDPEGMARPLTSCGFGEIEVRKYGFPLRDL